MSHPPLHPSPQLRRREWLELDGAWGFAHDDANVGLRDGWPEDAAPFDRSICVPYPPESRLSGIGDPAEHPVVWYRRSFRLADVPGYERGRHLVVHFGAVDYGADVWLNGRLVGRHEGGHSSFAIDLTYALLGGDEQVLVVRAEDQPRDLGQPRGKQYWETEPAGIWYRRTTGIWQPVWLEAVADCHIEDLAWTADAGRCRLSLALRLNREPAPDAHLRVRLSMAGEILADDTYAVTARVTERSITLAPEAGSAVRERLQWSAGRPNLVDALITLEDGRGDVSDQVASYAGLRSVEAADGVYLINGQPTYLRLVLDQGYWPQSHLAAPDQTALRREVELIKSLGFNGVRIHQKVEDPRFLYWCDRIGLYVWAEMANAYAFSVEAASRFTREWLEVVRRDYSHPSIISWVPFNESWGVPDLPRSAEQRDVVRGVYHLTRALDPTRPVNANDGWEFTVGDVIGIHDYALRGEELRLRYGTAEAVEAALRGRPQSRRAMLDGAIRDDQPVVLSEFGGITLTPQPGTAWFGYGSVANEDAFAERYEELLSAVLDSTALAGFCYTQLADTEQETNGLLRADRSSKLPLERIRAITARPSRAIPGDAIWAAQQATFGVAQGTSEGVPRVPDGTEGRAAG